MSEKAKKESSGALKASIDHFMQQRNTAMHQEALDAAMCEEGGVSGRELLDLLAEKGMEQMLDDLRFQYPPVTVKDAPKAAGTRTRTPPEIKDKARVFVYDLMKQVTDAKDDHTKEQITDAVQEDIDISDSAVSSLVNEMVGEKLLKVVQEGKRPLHYILGSAKLK